VTTDEARKDFFFEKKKQKTFDYLAALTKPNRVAHGALNADGVDIR
jgi:hypothetical protein